MTTAAQDPKREAELQTVRKMLPGIAIAPVYGIFNPHILQVRRSSDGTGGTRNSRLPGMDCERCMRTAEAGCTRGSQ